MNKHLQKISYCFALSVLFCSASYAQDSGSISSKYPKNSKVLYRTIPVEENIGKLIVSLGEKQEFQYEHWQGDAILVEQQIHLENAPNSVFKELLRRKRYDVTESLQSNTLVLRYDSIRNDNLSVNHKNVNEKVFLKILVPEKMGVELKRKTM